MHFLLQNLQDSTKNPAGYQSSPCNFEGLDTVFPTSRRIIANDTAYLMLAKQHIGCCQPGVQES